MSTTVPWIERPDAGVAVEVALEAVGGATEAGGVAN
jgi:hypothetical protein